MNRLFAVFTCVLLIASLVCVHAEEFAPPGLSGDTPIRQVIKKDPVSVTDDWTLLESLPLTITNPTGMTYDGDVFWITNYTASANSDIERVDPATGQVLSFIPSPDFWPCGIAFDGTYLWVHDFVVGHAVYPTIMSMCKVDTATGEVLEIYDSQYTSYSGGMAYDGQYLYYGKRPATLPGPCYIYRFDPQTGNDELFLDLGTTGIYGLEYYDGNLYYSDPSSMMYYKITMDGTVVDQSPACGEEPAGLAMTDGMYLWNVDNNTDMLYKMMLGAPDLDLTLTPHNPPIQIPAGGGTFTYDVDIENTTAAAITADVWIDALLPNGSLIPVIVRPALTFPANTTVSRPDLVQNVPGGAPAGEYTYKCTVGEIFGDPIDTDQFYFEKLAGDNGSVGLGEWELYGWEELDPQVSVKPAAFACSGAYPNPFNPTTTLSFTLPADQLVTLNVFDVSGRQVAQLVDGYRTAGTHEVTFDASNLASGVYIYQLVASHHTVTGKIMFLK